MRNRCGQAAIEFVVSLFLLLILIIGMVFLNDLSWTSLFLQANVRGQAGKDAMSDATLANVPDAIKDWNNGKDNIPYTADDKAEKGGASAATALQTLTQSSVHSEGDWASVADNSVLPVSMAKLYRSPSLATATPCVEGDETVDVEVPSFLRENVYGKDSVKIHERVWMPLLGGLF